MQQHKFIIGLLLWVLVWGLSLIVFPIFKAKAESPTIDVYSLSLKDVTLYFAGMYQVDPKVAMAVLKCESQYGTLPNGDGGKAKGPWQYWDDTWQRHYKEFYKETGIVLTKGVPNDDTRLAMWAFSKGKAKEWTTYVAIQKGGTYSFYSRALGKNFTVKCSL